MTAMNYCKPTPSTAPEGPGAPSLLIRHPIRDGYFDILTEVIGLARLPIGDLNPAVKQMSSVR
jgi:hypothetical protein